MSLTNSPARTGNRLTYLSYALIALTIGTAPLGPSLAGAQTPTAKIAIAVSVSGGSTVGPAVLNAARLAVEEANAEGGAPRIELAVHDDRSSQDGAREIARQIVATDALVVVGPGLTIGSLAAGPLYAEAGLISIVPHAHGAGGPASPTTFRPVFSMSEMGEALASYLRHVLDGARALVIYADNGYGRPFMAGFRTAAEQRGIAATFHAFSDAAQVEEAARRAAADPERPAIILGMTENDAARALITLRRHDARATILGTSAIASDSFAEYFADEPEHRQDRGFFTNGVYAISPSIPDSANAETLAFAARHRLRFGHEPRWEAVQGFDATRLAIAAVRAVGNSSASDLPARRKAVRDYLAALDSPARAMASLTGPLWFTAERGRQQATRVGRFHGVLFESAPVQLVPISNPSSAEIASGAVVETAPSFFVRRQQVVYTGVFLNEIPRVDIAQSTFTADIYLWVRFARGSAGAGAANPTEIDFPDLVRGGFDANRPAEESDLDDGTTYRLWRMRGDFKNDFALHRYPLDRQTLALRFFNARAASDRLVYVQDRRSLPAAVSRNAASGGAAIAAEAAQLASIARFGDNVSPVAFRNLTQWDVLGTSQRRDILVTESALGNPRLVGIERVRELSGFNMTVELRRRVIATLAKTLLPLGLMALIMFASLYFPPALVKEKVTVAITGALSGAVLLSSINSQLGNVGYVIAVEYGFYMFFILCLLCIVAVLSAEQLRVAGRGPAAGVVERSSRYLFLLGFLGTGAAAWVAILHW